VGQQGPGEGEHSPSRGPRPLNSPKCFPSDSNQGGRIGRRVEVPIGHCPLGRDENLIRR